MEVCFVEAEEHQGYQQMPWNPKWVKKIALKET